MLLNDTLTMFHQQSEYIIFAKKKKIKYFIIIFKNIIAAIVRLGFLYNKNIICKRYDHA